MKMRKGKYRYEKEKWKIVKDNNKIALDTFEKEVLLYLTLLDKRGREFVQVETAKPNRSAWRGGAVGFSWTKSLVCPSRV